MSEKRKIVEAWHVTALALAVRGREHAEIAKLLGKPVGRVQRALNTEWAQEQLAAFNEIVIAKTADAMVDPIMRFQSALGDAIQKEIDLMNCGDPKVEHLAACRVIDNCGYTPIKRVAVSEDTAFKQLSPAELEEVRQTGRIPDRALRLLPSPTTEH